METCTFDGCGRPAFVKQTEVGSLCNGHYAQFRRGKELQPLRGYKHQGVVDANKDICPFPDCGRTSWHKHGYCQTHQRQIWAANGDDAALQPIRNHSQQTGNECQEEGCDRPAKSRGYCSKHYRQDWGTCDLPGCDSKKHNKQTGYCAKHYAKARKLVPVQTETEEVEHAKV